VRYTALGMGITSESNSDDHANLHELNFIEAISVLAWTDSGCIHIQISQQKRTYVIRNWFLNSGIIGSRFDAPQQTMALDELGWLGNTLYNVGYNLWQGLMIKGDRHQTVGNSMSCWTKKWCYCGF